MGQYYRPTNLDKKESLSSHDFDNGLKLMEHSYIGNNFVNVVEKLIADGGHWHGDRIEWSGDYSDPETDENGEVITFKDEDGDSVELTIYNDPSNVRITPNETEIENFQFLVNLDSKEYVDINKTTNDEWSIHPLPLLTCNGCVGGARGGGDFRGDDPKGLVGKWARNRVVSQKEKPIGFNELIFDLVE